MVRFFQQSVVQVKPWRHLNLQGRVLAVFCVINMLIAVIQVKHGSYASVFSTLMAAFCGVCTYIPRYHKFDAEEINNRDLDSDE